jgi:phosphoglycolate phosphatase-like HAD superfamily hydrolase
MNYLNKILFALLINLFIFEANAQIIQASSVSEIKAQISKFNNADTLVLFDVDYVLLAPKDSILRYAGETDRYRAKYFKALTKDFQEQEITLDSNKIPMPEYLISQILSSCKIELVSPEMPRFVNSLDSQNITAIGFTANSTGKYGVVKNEAKLHLSRLKSLGYHFTHNDDLLKEDFPEYISGVVFTNKKDKGKILIKFLKQLNRQYKNIVFIDDRLKNLNSVQNALKDQQINYLAIQYTELKDKNELLNRDIADKQFQILRQQHKWISDDEACELIKKK